MNGQKNKSHEWPEKLMHELMVGKAKKSSPAGHRPGQTGAPIWVPLSPPWH